MIITTTAALFLSLLTQFSPAHAQTSEKAVAEVYCECVIYNSDMIEISNDGISPTSFSVVGITTNRNPSAFERCLQAESQMDLINFCSQAYFNAHFKCTEKAKDMSDGTRAGTYYGDLVAGSCQGPYLSE